MAGERGLTSARALLKHRQARISQRLYARPREGDGIGDGPEKILTRERSLLTTRLRAAAGLGRRETVEAQEWGTGRLFPGRFTVDCRAGALQLSSE